MQSLLLSSASVMYKEGNDRRLLRAHHTHTPASHLITVFPSSIPHARFFLEPIPNPYPICTSNRPIQPSCFPRPSFPFSSPPSPWPTRLPPATPGYNPSAPTSRPKTMAVFAVRPLPPPAALPRNELTPLPRHQGLRRNRRRHRSRPHLPHRPERMRLHPAMPRPRHHVRHVRVQVLHARFGEVRAPHLHAVLAVQPASGCDGRVRPEQLQQHEYQRGGDPAE